MRWLEQSKPDAKTADMNRREGYHEVACSLCQHAAEKALRAFLYQQGKWPVIGYSVYLLCTRCQAYREEFSLMLAICRKLDQYYIPTRYPNGLPGGIPHEVSSEENAREAQEKLERIMELVSGFLIKVES
jgi:HEPN domain-containing protein